MEKPLASTTGKVCDSRGVASPLHYNTHPSGVEVIEVNRHMTANTAAAFKYVLRRGIKVEPGGDAKTTARKDLDKATYYLVDEHTHCPKSAAARWPGEAAELLHKVIMAEPNQLVRNFCVQLEQWLVKGDRNALVRACDLITALKAGL